MELNRDRIERLGKLYSLYENYSTPSEEKQFRILEKKSNELLEKNNSTFFDDLSDSDISELEKLTDKLAYQSWGVEDYAEGGKVSDSDIGETVMVIGEDNVVGDLIGIDGNTAFVDFSDYDKRPESGEKRDYFDISDLKVVEYDWDKNEYYAEGGEVEMIEIAEDGSNVPPKLMEIFSEFNEDEDAYKEMERLRAKANEIGYDFSYGLDGTPTEFCEIPKKSWGGGIAIGTAVGGYVGYKIGRARPQKRGFETEKKIGKKIGKTLSKGKDKSGEAAEKTKKWFQS